MPFFKPRTPPQNDVEVILESIAAGQFDDDTIDELQRLADLSDDAEIDLIAGTLLGYIVTTEDRNVLIGTVKALTVLPFMPEGKDEDVIRLMVSLFAVPQNMRITLQHKMLQNEILRFLLTMVKADESYAKLMMTELIASMEYAYITDDAEAYPALEMLARNNPEYFRPHTETLVKQLGSINKVTRAQSAKLIGIIGGKYPEYVSSAMPVLQSLASFYPDAQVKHNASEAYQILYHGLRLDVVDTVSMKDDDRPKQRSMGFADILKKKAAELLSKPPHETPGERQRAARNAARERMARERSLNYHANDSESIGGVHMSQPSSRNDADNSSEDVNLSDMEGFETEIKDILDKTRDEFTSDAEGILNSIGVGHLSIKNRDKLTITDDGKVVDNMTAGDGGTASQHEAQKQPIHARTSHLDIRMKHKAVASNDINSKLDVKTDAVPEKHLPHEMKRQEESEQYPEKRPKTAPVHGTHSPAIKAGFEKDLQGRLAARSAEKPPRAVRPMHNKIIEDRPAGHDAITLPGNTAQDKPATETISANVEKPVAKKTTDRPGSRIVQDIKPLIKEDIQAKKVEDTIEQRPIKTEGSPVITVETPIAQVSIKAEETAIQEKKIAEPETPIPIRTEELRTIDKEKVQGIIKTEDKAIHKVTKHITPAEPDIRKNNNDGKLRSPVESVENVIMRTKTPAMQVPVKQSRTPVEKEQAPVIKEEPAAKRVEKVLAWFEKVGVPEPGQPKIERQPEVVEEHSGRIPVKPMPETAAHDPKPMPKPETKPPQAKAEAPVEAHHAQHSTKPPARPENKQEVARVETAPEKTAPPMVEKPIPPKVEKPVPPKMERKIESSVLPPRSAVSRHETSWSSDPITPPVARKISESKMGMTEKPMEGKDAGKKETVVPGSSISGFGPNKRIYQCPKCGGRTLVEGELCKICKMTMEHPQDMVRCERCGLMNNRNIKFCRKCGSKLDKDHT